MINTYKGVERVVRYAYEYASKRNKSQKLTLCDKANVLTYGHDLWRRVFKSVGENFDTVEKVMSYLEAYLNEQKR